MAKRCVSFAALLILAGTAAAQVEFPLKNEITLVQTTYNRLSAASTQEDVKVMYTECPAELRGDLWLYHYSRVLNSVELTPRQRAVVYEAAGLVLAGVCEKRDDPKFVAWKSSVTEKMDADAKAAFDRPLMKDVFMHLGGPALSRSLRAGSEGLKAISTSWDCTCNTADDWCCVLPTCPEVCRRVFRCAFTPDGCGWWFNEPCNGNCT